MRKSFQKKEAAGYLNSQESERICPHCNILVDCYSIEDNHKAGMELAAHSIQQIGKLFYAQCSSCRTVFHLGTQAVKYEDDYFNREYQYQYGLSYAEDRENIDRVNRARLKWLSRYASPRKTSSVLDIGCALGYFLALLEDAGFENLHGIDISRYAIKNAASQKSITYKQAGFFDYYKRWQSKGIPFSLITAFFVLEHFPQQGRIFQAVADMLEPDGLFCFSVPSTNGPHFHFHKQDWFTNHPRDHFADYSPESLRRILPQYGFEVLDFRVPSFHIERLSGPFGLLPMTGEIGERLYQLYCQYNHYGDTIECLARKTTTKQD
jgi:SAM-dependent methyltransferase